MVNDYRAAEVERTSRALEHETLLLELRQRYSCSSSSPTASARSSLTAPGPRAEPKDCRCPRRPRRQGC
eukprot:scaffold68662_cov59-Phaeocystis_antarctica.AAC.3